jgi:hypothetical protein
VNLTSHTSFCGMDSPLVNRIFRRLFAHETCSRYRIYRPQSLNGSRPSPIQTRSFLWDAQEQEQQKRYGKKEQAKKDDFWRARQDLLFIDKTEDYKRFPMVTADHLRPRKERPRNVKMTVRDFIEGMLYICHFDNCMVLTCNRQPVQSELWLLLQASRHLLARRALRLPKHEGRARILRHAG